MPGRSSVCTPGKKSDLSEWIFMKFAVWGFSDKSAEKIKILLKPDKINGHFA
jgi:hypothetical protein